MMPLPLLNQHLFSGQDILIDIFSAIVVLMIAFFSVKYYKLSGKNKNHLWVAGAFFTLGLGFIFEILTNFTIYRTVSVVKQVGLAAFTYQGVVPTNILFNIGFLGYEVLTLFGLYLLFMLYQSKKSVTNFIITTYLLLISIYFAPIEHVFHLTAALLLILITYEYYLTHKKTKSKTTKMLMCSFGIIALSQIVSIFINFHSVMHAIAGLVQLIGYVLLLITFVLVLKNAKKTR
jgi:hypothetical protein